LLVHMEREVVVVVSEMDFPHVSRGRGGARRILLLRYCTVQSCTLTSGAGQVFRSFCLPCRPLGSALPAQTSTSSANWGLYRSSYPVALSMCGLFVAVVGFIHYTVQYITMQAGKARYYRYLGLLPKLRSSDLMFFPLACMLPPSLPISRPRAACRGRIRHCPAARLIYRWTVRHASSRGRRCVAGTYVAAEADR